MGGSKRKDRASSSQVPIPPPKHGRTQDDSSSPPRPPPIPVRYEKMPLNHKKKFFLYDDCGCLKKYIELVCWLRSMGCFCGSVFDDIPNLNWEAEKGYPLLEVEVITPQDNSAKFLIYKNTLYLIAFLAAGLGYQFTKCGFKIEGFTVLGKYDGKYKTKPWLTVGPGAMINAVNTLALGLTDTDTNGTLSPYELAWDVFVFHLCEAGRYYAVESYVGKTLVPPQDGECVKRTYKDEEDDILVMTDGSSISYEDDIYREVEASGCIDFAVLRESPVYFNHLVKQYSNLSKVWFVKSLTGGSLFPISDDIASDCHMRSRKSLRCTLGVLFNVNLDKVVKEWRKKIGSKGLTPEVFRMLESRIDQLQEEGKVRNSLKPVP